MAGSIQFIQDVILPSSNKKLKQQSTYGEFLQWLGLWILMSTRDGYDTCSFWSLKKIDMFDGSGFHHLTELMSRNCFKAILGALSYVDHDPPVLLDHFWEVQWFDCCMESKHGRKFLALFWINVIDESMSKWVNKYTCLGFMFVPRKPWPFGNEFDDADCADSDIIWQVELREGKDHLQHLGGKEHDEKGKTVGTLLHLTQPIHGVGRLVVLDSSFCVLQGLVELKKVGVFAHALIKK